MAVVTSELLNEIRDVTDEEVDFYTENGWVMLRGFFSGDLAAELRRIAEPMVQPLGVAAASGLRSVRPLSRNHVEPFKTIAWGPRMASAAHRLINRARLTDDGVQTRFLDDLVWCKDGGSDGTGYHQDSSVEGVDRIGRLNFWIALAEVTPEMGAMRFVTRSHHEGPLGLPETPDELLGDDGELDPAKLAKADPQTRETLSQGVLGQYPKLLDIYDLSPPFHYQPGDATVHQGWMIHGGPPNATDRQRWSYIVEYTAADARYRDGRYGGDGKLGVLMSDDAAYPVVYPQPAGS